MSALPAVDLVAPGASRSQDSPRRIAIVRAVLALAWAAALVIAVGGEVPSTSSDVPVAAAALLASYPAIDVVASIAGALGTDAPARLLPSGDAYFLLDGAERELLVPRAERRERLWTSRVWPGALLVDGEIRGTWRRAQHVVRIETWGRLSRAARDAVEAEAGTLPLPGLERPIDVVWEV